MLLIRPYTKATDTLPSYLLRLTAANYYQNSMQLLRDEHYLLTNNRLPGKKIFFGDFNLDRVAMLANINAAQLSELSFKHTFSTRCMAFGQEFLTKAINFSYVRLCPFCYQEQQSIPFANSLLAKTYCTEHSCLLLSTHPETKRRLNWATHFLWRDAPDWKPQESMNSICEAELAINEQLEMVTRNNLVIADQVLNLAEYCDLLEFFARFHQLAHTSSCNSKYDFNTCRHYYAPAHYYLAEWPERYFELLEHFETHPMASSRLTGVRKCFRDLYDDLYSPENQNSGAYKLLKSRFEQYLKDHYSTGLLMSSLSIVSDEVKAESSYMSKEQISKILNCRVSRVNLYVREGLLLVSKTLVNGTDLFQRKEVLKLKTQLNECLSLEQCARSLCISTYHLRQLLRSGVIKPLLIPSKNNRDWLVQITLIKKVINKLKSRADNKNDNTKNKSAVKRFTFAKFNLANLISEMLNGKIKFNFDLDKHNPLSLKQFTPHFEIADDKIEEYISPAEAVQQLGVNKNAIYDFIKLGYLNCDKIQVKRTPRPIKMIPKKSIDNFKSKYRLSSQLKKSSGKLTLVSGPRVDGCCVNLYSA
ncbi:hypothetical protein ACSSVW_002076 [Pseudoalteromonas sp. MBR-15]|jgi:hypothetical protein